MTLPSDATLVPLLRRAQAHEPRAFDQLYDLFADLLFRYAYLCSGSREIAESVVNTVFVKLVGAITALRLPRHDLAHGIIRWLLERAQSLLQQHATSGAPSITTIFGSTERQLAPDFVLAAAVQYLTPEQQQVIVLRCVERLPLQSVAVIIGQSPTIVKQIQQHALVALIQRAEYSPKMPEAW